MNNKQLALKTVLFLTIATLMLFATIKAASAALTDNATGYYGFAANSTTITDSIGISNGVASTTDVISSAWIPLNSPNTFSFRGNGSRGRYVNLSDTSDRFDFGNGAFAMSLSFNITNIAGAHVLLSRWQYSTGDFRRWQLYIDEPVLNQGAVRFDISTDGTDAGRTIVHSNTTLFSNKSYHVIMQRSGNNLQMFINCQLVNTTSFSGSVPADTIGVSIGVGQPVSLTDNPTNGYIDEVLFRKGSNFTSAEIAQLCAGTTTSYYPFADSLSTITFNSPANNSIYFNNASVTLQINTTVTNAGGSINQTHFIYNSSGSLVLNSNGTGANFSSNSSLNLPAGNYFINASFTNGTSTNVSGKLNFTLYNFTAGSITNPANNSAVSNNTLNFTWTNTTFNPTDAQVKVANFTLYLLNSTGSINKTIVTTTNLSHLWNVYNENLSTGVWGLRVTVTSNLSHQANYSDVYFNLTTNAILNITARDAINNTILGAGSVNVTDQTTGVLTQYNTTNGNFSFHVVKGRTYTILADFPAYSLTTTNTTPLSTVTQSYLNLSLYTNNSVYVFIYDESTTSLITQNISITFTGSLYYEYNTSNGTKYIDNLQAGTYLVSFSGGSYNLKQYIITIGPRSTQTLNAFLSASNFTTIFSILDFDSSAILPGATVTQSRLINGTWTIVDTKVSDISGRVQFGYVAYIPYQFISSLNGYVTQVFNLTPVLFDSYNIRMEKTTTLSPGNTPDNLGLSITYYTTGGGVAFYNNQNNTLTWVISSPTGSLDSYDLNITYPGGQMLDSGSNAMGEQFANTFQINNANLTDQVIISYCYQTTTSAEKCFIYPYGIIGSYGNGSLLANKDNTYGMGVFERTLIATGANVFISGVFYFLGGLLAGIPMTLFLLYLFVKTGFIPLWGILPSVLVGVALLLGGTRK